MNDSKYNILENRNIIIAVIGVIVVVLILVLIFSIIPSKKENKVDTWVTKLTQANPENLQDGYSIEYNNTIYNLPKYNENDYYIEETSIDKNSLYGDSIYIINDDVIPIIDLSSNSTRLIYKGENLPDKFKLMKVQFDDYLASGLILDDDNLVKEIKTDEFSDDIIGFKCDVLTPDTAEIINNRVMIKSNNSPTKLSFTKGTIYKEVEVKNISGYGKIINTLLEDEYFKDIELTKNSYGYIKIGDKEKTLDTGYYILYNTDKFDNENLESNRLLIKIKNNDLNEESPSYIDAKNQYEIINKEINYINLKQELNLKNIKGKLPKNTKVYYPIFSKTDSNSEVTNIVKLESVDKSINTTNDYYFDITGTTVFNNTRYYYGTLVFSSADTKNTNEISIDIAIDSDSYSKYLDNSTQYIKSLGENNKDINQINSSDSIDTFKGFKSITYDNKNNKIEKIL